MSPRRRRRRRVAPFASVLGLSALVAFILIGGVLFIGQGSGPFHSSINLSFAEQADALAGQSNASGAALGNLVSTMPGLRRSRLQASLDALVSDTAAAARRADALTPPQPADDVGSSFQTAMADRAQAIAELRLAIDGLLALAPLPTVGAAAPSGVGSQASGTLPPALSAGKATSEIDAAGALLEQADRVYAAARLAFVTAPGNGRLAVSRWVPGDVDFGGGAAATLVDELTGSATLVPNADVRLVAVRLSPPVVPPAPPSPGQAAPPATAPGVSVLSPTRRLFVTPTIDNVGNVAASGLALTVTIQPLPQGPATTLRRTVSLAPGASVVVALRALPVRPGATYGLTVTISPPPNQTDRSAVSVPVTVEISPELNLVHP